MSITRLRGSVKEEKEKELSEEGFSHEDLDDARFIISSNDTEHEVELGN